MEKMIRGTPRPARRAAALLDLPLSLLVILFIWPQRLDLPQFRLFILVFILVIFAECGGRDLTLFLPLHLVLFGALARSAPPFAAPARLLHRAMWDRFEGER